ncbi:MAG: CHASE domain-containing protein [Burkholderiales bacterium]
MTSARSVQTAIGLRLLPWLVLVATLSVTWIVWDHERQSARYALHAQFDFALKETVSRIEQRAAAYEQMLRGVQGVLATTDLNNQASIHRYVDALQLDANFAGVKVIGIVQRVPMQDKAAHTAAMRKAGLPTYAIYPESTGPLYAPIVQREPSFGNTGAPLGLDVWQDPVRRVALEAARDSGMAAISGKLRLAIDRQADALPGFVMYLPVFASDLPHDSVAQRRANLIGWVYAAFHVNDFMASLYGKQSPGLSMAIYDGVDTNESTLLYRTADGVGGPASRRTVALSASEYMVVAGHSWTLSLASLPEFGARTGQDATNVTAVAGAALSFALAVLVWLMVNGRTRALRLAAAMTEELREMAQHDPLTGLPNRALFSDRLNQELARAKRESTRFAVIFLDLDEFKPVNDNFGHAIGDQLLQQVALRLQSAIRAVDTVGRIGGDEFVILVAGLSGKDFVLTLTEKINQSLRQVFVVDGHEMHISASLGFAVYPEDGGDELTLTRCADDAMYRVKSRGQAGINRANSAPS